MKGECAGRELAPGAPVSVGSGGMPGHSREGTAGRIEAMVKGECQDNATRSLPSPPLLGGTQGNGTRGFTVAGLTDATNGKGNNLQVPSIQSSAIGSIRVPSFRGQESAVGHDGEGEYEMGGSIKVPTINEEIWNLSCPADVERESQRESPSSTSGDTHLTSTEGGDQGKAAPTLTQGESQGVATQDKVQASSNTVLDLKHDKQNSEPETLNTPTAKRLSQDSVTLQTASESGVKRLKTDAAAGQTDTMDGSRWHENATNSSDITPIKRVSRDSDEELPGLTDSKRMRQDTPTDTTRLTSAATQHHNTEVPEAANTASQNTTTGMSGEPPMVNDQNSALAMTNSGHTEKASEGVGTESLTAETVKENGTISEANQSVEESSEVISANPPAGVLIQDKDKGNTEDTEVPIVDSAGPIQPKESKPVPDVKTADSDTLNGGTDGTGESGVKHESQGSASGGSGTTVIKEENTNGDVEKPRVRQPCSEESSTVKNGDKDVVKEEQGASGEGKGQVFGGPPILPVKKPEMVSTETQCDNLGLSVKEECGFQGEDGGEPGECLGGCEPGKKPHKCFQCDTSFRTPYELSRHCRVHSGERPYQCRLCHRCFKRKDHVEIHMRRHAEDRRFACSECGACFVTSSCLLRHQRRTHQALVPIAKQRPSEGENREGEGEGEAGDTKGDGKDQSTSKDGQKNGRRSKKNKPDTTYRPGGKTVCIIKKRNLRQRSYSFVELEDDVECFESDEEDRIPFLKVEEQRQEVHHEEYGGGGQGSDLEHSLFPPSLFNPEASLEHLLLLGEVSRMLSNSLTSGPVEEGATQTNVDTPSDQTVEPPQIVDDDAPAADDDDCDLPLVACDVTFMEDEEEIAAISLSDEGPAGSEEADKDKTMSSEPLQSPIKTEPHQTAAVEAKHHHHITPPVPAKPPPPPPTNNKPGGTSVGAMGVPRTAWVVPPNNAKGKNTCDACRRRNEANRLAQEARERQALLAVQAVIKQENEEILTNVQEHQVKEEFQPEPPTDIHTPPRDALTPPMDTSIPPDVKPTLPIPIPPEVKPTLPMATPPPPMDKRTPPLVTPTPPAVTPTRRPPPPKPQEAKSAVNKRSRRPLTTKKKVTSKVTVKVEPGGGGGGVSKRPYKCDLCSFSFRSATELKRHASTHSGERPFLCELCGAGFMRKCHLQLHVRRHSGERRHACQECRMRFFTPSDLARHQAIHQVGDKPLECHLCHLTFRRAFHLERHIRRHNDAAPFACKLCGAFFSSSAALRSHDKHHRTPAPHACPDCTAAFTTATALSRHRRVHSARHHRLLRAIERHATAKSSYECVSSEGSPLSLVIRKVSAMTPLAGEGKAGVGVARDAPTDRLLKDKKEKAMEKDKDTSGFSTSDQESVGKVEGKEAAPLNLSMNKATNNGEKSVCNPSTMDEGMEGKGKEREDITSNPSAVDDAIKVKENVIPSPSITDKIKDTREDVTCNLLPPPTDREKDKNKTPVNTANAEKVKAESERKHINTRAKNSKRKKEILSIPFIQEKVRQNMEKATSLLSSIGQESGLFGEMNDSIFGAHVSTVQGDPYVFGGAVTASHEAINKETNIGGAMNLNAIKTGMAAGYHNAMPVFPSLNSGMETSYGGGMASLPVTSRKTQAMGDSGSRISGGSGKKEVTVVSADKLNGKSDPLISAAGKEVQGRSSCSLLLPTSREMEALTEEIRCRTTYQLSTPGVGQESLFSGTRLPHHHVQEGGMTGSTVGGDTASMMEGRTTTS